MVIGRPATPGSLPSAELRRTLTRSPCRETRTAREVFPRLSTGRPISIFCVCRHVPYRPPSCLTTSPGSPLSPCVGSLSPEIPPAQNVRVVVSAVTSLEPTEPECVSSAAPRVVVGPTCPTPPCPRVSAHRGATALPVQTAVYPSFRERDLTLYLVLSAGISENGRSPAALLPTAG
jgi:hypothetical protein